MTITRLVMAAAASPNTTAPLAERGMMSPTTPSRIRADRDACVVGSRRHHVVVMLDGTERRHADSTVVRIEVFDGQHGVSCRFTSLEDPHCIELPQDRLGSRQRQDVQIGLDRCDEVSDLRAATNGCHECTTLRCLMVR